MEGPRTWEYCDPAERKFMPVLVDPGAGADRQFWLVDGKIRGHVRHVIKPNVLMTGTDYGHVDMSVEIDALRTLEKNGKVRPEPARKILSDNSARSYGIQ